MNLFSRILPPLAPILLALTGFVASSSAQEIIIPDPGLNAAIRDALQKPNGPLTESDLLSLTNLFASSRNISNIAGLEAAHNLVDLDLDFNSLRSLSLPAGLTNLTVLEVLANQLTNVTLPGDVTNLVFLDLDANQLSTLVLPAGLTHLFGLRMDGNQLGSFALPAGMTNLASLLIAENQLTNLTLPPDLIQLTELDLGGNQLARLALPRGLTNLSSINLQANQLTNVTLPSDLTNLTSLFMEGNPLTTFVLPEPLADGELAGLVATLQNQGVPVFTYPLAIQLVRPLPLTGAFRFGIQGPPGAYTVQASVDLANWSELGTTTNSLGAINFVDATAHDAPTRFYRVRSGL
jgi:internalin A